ncbi:MAG: PhoX family phosphatase [Blastocatellia bacterium]|nr:PhoX family phosphatase [Blastocatellia bacterium]
MKTVRLHRAETSETFAEIVARRIERRAFLKGMAAVAPVLLADVQSLFAQEEAASPNFNAQTPDKLTFQPLAMTQADTVTVAPGYTSQVVIRWGDPLFPNAPAFDPAKQTAAAQARQFGFNCDFVGFFPFERDFRASSNEGLLVVNHEYTDGPTMFANYKAAEATKEQVDIELAAHGLTVVEIERSEIDGWRYRIDSGFNRRITGETPCAFTGPAAGNELLKVSYDPRGLRARGMLNNCSAGKTPWGTVLTCEENFNQYFANTSKLPDSDPRKAMHNRYGVTAGASERRWENHYSRFDVAKEPNEPFRFGWVVEIDPFNPLSIPKKRTALGRLKHEAATFAAAYDGRAVVYTGDDERFECMYKFISKGKFNRLLREENAKLLDEGTLYVARFKDDGTGEWLPLIGGQGALREMSQADVCIHTRTAAQLVGGTKMDRPEDIEINPVNGKVYAVMTNNTQRGTSGRPGTDKANPRAENKHGHIIEITEADNDPGSLQFRWEILMLCGDPTVEKDGTYFAGFDRRQVSALSCPDNITFDNQGNLWIATDGMPRNLKNNDSIYACPVEGPERGFVRQFLTGPSECEICGPEMTPNNETLFCAIQHPGEGGSIEKPLSRWPDGTSYPRPSVIAVTREDDGRTARVIGS